MKPQYRHHQRLAELRNLNTKLASTGHNTRFCRHNACWWGRHRQTYLSYFWLHCLKSLSGTSWCFWDAPNLSWSTANCESERVTCSMLSVTTLVHAAMMLDQRLPWRVFLCILHSTKTQSQQPALVAIEIVERMKYTKININ